jgi:hypothetical protein
MRLKLVSTFLILGLLCISFDASGEVFQYDEKIVSQGRYYYEMVYIEDGGKLKLRLDSSDNVDLYISDENDIKDITDFLRTGEGSFETIHRGYSLTDADLELKKKGSGNVIILILYKFDPEGTKTGNDRTVFNLTLESSDKSDKWSLDLSILLYIAIPIVVLLPLAYWIRRKV